MELGAVIVAAGMSSRMGEFKALKNIFDRPVIIHMIEKFKIAGVKKIVIVTGNHASALEEALKEVKDLQYVFNKAYKTSDMFTSAKLGLSTLQGKCTRFFFTPVDAPAFSVSTLKALLEVKEGIIKPRYKEKGGHPILIDEKLIYRLMDYQGACGMKGALETCKESIKEVEVEDEGILFNTNTQEDFERMRLYYEKERH